MDTSLIASLQAAERALRTELRASIPYRRLEEIRRLLALYRDAPPIGATLDALLGDGQAVRAAPAAQPQPVIAMHGSERA